ncbi:OmpA family protein [Chromobacterium haemolyticum]|uniref:hypothetical protein n=1 Tax=Chromobacterium haemolyticum TaxID=394935 RepID=UPI0029543B13|nr:hypothetical protein [Chromobacterium haemolyticum]WON81952.1 hypothetical protein OK026_12360 [Chromobacterium haemolyticum]
MNWKQLVLGTATVTLLAACASTKPADTTAGTQQPTTPQTTAPVDTGSGNQNQVSVDPLNDPNSPLAKRSVYFGFDSSSVDANGKPVVETHSAYLKQNADKKSSSRATPTLAAAANTTWPWVSAAPRA